MDCKFSTSNLPIQHKYSTTDPNFHPPSPSRLVCMAQNKQGLPLTSTQAQETSPYNVKFQTLEACKLGISRYPDFEYNADGGIGTGIGRKEESDEELSVKFDVGSLYIPALTGATTKFLGLPLPPFLKIEIVPEVFEGTINTENGKVELQFGARFWFSIGKIYRAPPLMVETTLTSEESLGTIRKGKGARIDERGICTLVGVATVEPIDDFLMDSFLALPTECIAALSVKISID